MASTTVTPDASTPGRSILHVTYTSGEKAEYDLSRPKVLYEANRLGIDDDLDATFFMFWIAAGKPGVNGSPLTVDSARPALEAWLDTVKESKVSEVKEDGPPTKRRGASRGSAE